MNSQILNYIGLGGIDIGYILIGMAAMIVLSFLLIMEKEVFNFYARKRCKKSGTGYHRFI